VTVNPFNVIQLVVDSKGGVRSEPFKDHFTRRKNHTDRYPTNAADPAYVFVPPQLKYAQLCSSPFHTTFILTKQKSTPRDPASASYSLSFAVWLDSVEVAHYLEHLSRAGCPSLRPVNSLSRRSGCGFSGSGFAPLCFAFNRSVDAHDGIATLVEKLVEPQHRLPRRTGFPQAHCVLGLKKLGQPIVALAEHLV
jgi:hypothetical protein